MIRNMLKNVKKKLPKNLDDNILLSYLCPKFKINKQMKKLATLLVVGAVAFMYACGPSAKEIEEKRIADSIRVADSLAMVQAEQQRIADSIAKAQEEKRKMDSIAHEDSVKKGLIKKVKTMKKK